MSNDWNETELRVAILQVLLAARRQNPRSGGATGFVLMNCLESQVDPLDLEQALHWLLDQRFVAVDERAFLITADGVDFVADQPQFYRLPDPPITPSDPADLASLPSRSDPPGPTSRRSRGDPPGPTSPRSRGDPPGPTSPPWSPGDPGPGRRPPKRDPDDPSRVPLRRKPSSGAGELALPLPDVHEAAGH